MNFLQKLDFMMEKYSLNKRTLSLKCGIPYTTVDGWYKKGYEGMKISTLRILASYFNTTLDFWVIDSITDPARTDFDIDLDAKKSPGGSEGEEGDELRSILVRNFDQLNQEGQEKLVDLSDDMVSSGKYIKTDKNQLGKTQGT